MKIIDLVAQINLNSTPVPFSWQEELTEKINFTFYMLPKELMRSFIMKINLFLIRERLERVKKPNMIMEKVLKYEADIAKDISEIKKYLGK